MLASRTMPLQDQLPAEVILLILESLLISDILNFALTSKYWADFVTAHENTIYYAAAIKHEYLPENASHLFEDARQLHTPRTMYGVTNWKALCKFHLAYCYPGLIFYQVCEEHILKTLGTVKQAPGSSPSSICNLPFTELK